MLQSRVFFSSLLLTACSLMLLPPQSAVAATVTYYGCVSNSTGAISIVSKTAVCKAGFTKISWNQVGPQGPAGAKGATGAAGPVGPKGMTGAQGPQGIPGATGPQGPQGVQGPAGISSGNFVSVGNSGPLAVSPGTLVAQTNPVAATGTYYINASALLHVDANDGAYCYTTSQFNGGGGLQGGSDSNNGPNSGNTFDQASITDSIFVGAGDTFQLWCYSATGAANSTVFNAGLSATLINSPSFAKNKRKATLVLDASPSSPKLIK